MLHALRRPLAGPASLTRLLAHPNVLPTHPLCPPGGGTCGGGFRGKRESGRENPYSCLVLAGARSMDERRAALEVRGGGGGRLVVMVVWGGRRTSGGVNH